MIILHEYLHLSRTVTLDGVPHPPDPDPFWMGHSVGKWEGDTLEFSRAGAKGSIRIAKHDVHIHVELGFLMSALKPVIEGEIGRKLDKEFGAA